LQLLKTDIIPERYVRNFNAFSPKDQIKLLRSTVAVVGLGGLGGGVTEILARIGIGTLILIDGDVFEDTNLNRQMLSYTEPHWNLKGFGSGGKSQRN
jgi:molybdopterin-synthase adenylyltransferase